MVAQRMLPYRYFSVPLRLCASALLLLVMTSSNAAEPSVWKLWPFRSKPTQPNITVSPVAPASFQAPLSSPAPDNIEPFPLPPGFPTANDLYRQTNDDVLRKSWGCVNCHQGV